MVLAKFYFLNWAMDYLGIHCIIILITLRLLESQWGKEVDVENGRVSWTSVDLRDSPKVSSSSHHKISWKVLECWSWNGLVYFDSTKRLRSDGKDLRDHQVPFSPFPEESPARKPKMKVRFSTPHRYQRWEPDQDPNLSTRSFLHRSLRTVVLHPGCTCESPEQIVKCPGLTHRESDPLP